MPDLAIIRCTIEGEAESQEVAYSEAAASAKEVDNVLAARSAALARVTTAGLVVSPKSRWKKGESVRTGWRASRMSIVEVTDFEQLGLLIAELAGAGSTVSGPIWQLDSTNEVHR